MKCLRNLSLPISESTLGSPKLHQGHRLPPVPSHQCRLPQQLCLFTQDAHLPFFVCSGSVFQRYREGSMAFKQHLAERLEKN